MMEVGEVDGRGVVDRVGEELVGVGSLRLPKKEDSFNFLNRPFGASDVPFGVLGVDASRMVIKSSDDSKNTFMMESEK